MIAKQESFSSANHLIFIYLFIFLFILFYFIFLFISLSTTSVFAPEVVNMYFKLKYCKFYHILLYDAAS